MSKLTKSLSELDAMADELLSKSQQTEEITDTETEEVLEKSKATKEDEEELKPEDVSENVPAGEVETADNETEKTEEEDSKEEDSKEEDSEEENDDREEEEQLAKSIHSTFVEKEEIKKSIEVSEFLSAVTEVLSKSLADLVKNMQGSTKLSSDSNDVLAKSLHASLNLNKAMNEELTLVKSQNEVLRKSIEDGFNDVKTYVAEQLETFSRQPATMRKSVGNIAVHDKNFQKSLSGEYGSEGLSKSEVLTKLSAYMYSGNPLVQPSDIISYESGAPLRPEVAQLIKNNM